MLNFHWIREFSGGFSVKRPFCNLPTFRPSRPETPQKSEESLRGRKTSPKSYKQSEHGFHSFPFWGWKGSTPKNKGTLSAEPLNSFGKKGNKLRKEILSIEKKEAPSKEQRMMISGCRKRRCNKRGCLQKQTTANKRAQTQTNVSIV